MTSLNEPSLNDTPPTGGTTFKLAVPDMNCGHCKASVEKAVQSVDADAFITVDLPGRIVEIETTQPQADILAALAAKGYPSTVAG